MSNELKQHVIASLNTLRDNGCDIPTGEAIKPWLESQIKENGPVIRGILSNAVRKGIA